MHLRMHRAWSGLAAAAVLVALWSGPGGPAITHAQSAGCGVDLKLLVLSADGREPSLGAITKTLDYLGTPYVRHIVGDHPGALTPEFFADGCHAHFQAILQTTIDLAHQTSSGYASALTDAEAQALTGYEQQFRIRSVAWYTFPNAPLGFDAAVAVDTTSTPLNISLTGPGRALFPYMNPAASIPVQYAYTYLANAVDSSLTPLLVDAAGHTLGAIKAFPDGRESLLLTFDHNADLLHSTLLGYGLVNWATRGLFIGERHSYASPQIDDIFIDNHQWDAGTACGTDPETTPTVVRMSGSDLQKIQQWQAARNQQPMTAAVRLTLAFNGEGTTGIYQDDTLTPAAKSLQGNFYWVSHTYDHPYLDDISYGDSLDEIRLNNGVAATLGLSSYSGTAMVTPNITGLSNPAFMQAAADTGIRYLVSDASAPGYAAPFPNAGIFNPLQPSMLMIPRHANNLFYNVTTPAAWVGEYNCLYHAYWGRDFTYADVLAYEGNELARYLLRGDNAPWMYHQPNLVAYDGTHSLLTDVLDRAFAIYAGYVTWPIESPSMETLGASVARRMAFLQAHVTATLDNGQLSITSDRAVTVPITGVQAGSAQNYAGQWVAQVNVPASGTVTLPLPQDAAALPASWDHRDIGAVGVAGSATFDATTNAFTIRGAGADVWGSADAFHFAYLPVDGDVRVTARVTAIENVAAWVKAGVMIRETLDAASAHGFSLVSVSKGRAFQRRTTAGGASTSTAGGTGTAPVWVRIEREGTTVRSLLSSDGTSWTLVASDTIAMASRVFAGLAVSSHSTSAAAAATFDHVSFESLAPPVDPGALPPGWKHGDVGAVGAAGRAVYNAGAGVYTIAGAGADIWGAADAFHYAYVPLTGDGAVVARVATLEYTAAWTKAGVMIRATLDPDSAHGLMIVSAGKGTAFQRRTASGGASTSTSGVVATAPYWVRITRAGNLVTASTSADGVSWATVASDTIALPATAFVGLAVSSHTTSAAATATFDHVSVTAAPPPPPPSTALPSGWTHQDIGAVGASGGATYNASSGAFTLAGAGADVWGTADAFHYAWRTWSGDGTLMARVASVANVAAWVKAGVMIRASTDPASAQAFMLVSAGKGYAFQRRTANGAASTSTAGGAGSAPAWVRLQRSAGVITASVSADGVSWTTIGSDTFSMSADVLVGLAVSSHTTSVAATAVFDGVSIK